MTARPHDGELSPVGKVGIALILALVSVAAAQNIATGIAVHPRAFWIVLVGLACFVAAKLSVVAGGRWVSFGAARMSPGIANLYRGGYWLMAVGILATFA